MKLLKTIFSWMPVLVFSLVVASCGGSNSSRQAGEVLVDERGIAIQGYDPVAYHLVGTAVQGKAKYVTQWKAATWWFSSKVNRELFITSPEKYAPAYGGWCAYGMADGYAAQTDPVNAWTIYQGQLYLNWNAQVSTDWNADKAGYLKKSEPKWSTVQTQLQEGEATVHWH